MPVANYNLAGTVLAIQWTGSNLSDIQAAFPGWDVFTSSTSASIGLGVTSPDGEANTRWIDLNRWIVSHPAYGTAQPSLSNGFDVLLDSTFSQQYVPTS